MKKKTLPDPPVGLVKGIGLYTTVCLVVGSAVGSGIFKKPAVMAQQLGSPKLLLTIWIAAGILTMFGALSNAEVAAMFPETGGQFIFFQKMYGDFFAFLYGWSIFAVIQTGSIASITYIFSESLGHFWNLPRLSPTIESSFVIHIPLIGNIFPLAQIGLKITTIAVICFLTLVNYFGVFFGGKIQDWLTTLKLTAMLGLVAMALFCPYGSLGHFSEILPLQRGLWAGVVAALSGAFFAYDGWNNVTFVAAEVRDPQKTIPRGLLIGTSIVAITYLAINAAYIYVLPMHEMASSKIVAITMAQRVLGEIGGTVVTCIILLSTFGAANGSILTSARVHFAMARQKMFFPAIGKINWKYRTPGNSLLLQAFWCSLLVITGTFDTLADMLIFVGWIFYALAALGVFILRFKLPNHSRPYRVWGYPFVPAVFVGLAFVYVCLTLVGDIMAYSVGQTPIINSLFGLLLVFAGIPFYFFFHKKVRRSFL